MNSVPSSTVERIQRYLVGLRMPRALEALDATLKRFEQGDSSMLEVLETLLGEEFTTRETRRIRMALQTAKLGTIKTLAGYDFSFQPSLDRDRIMTLAQLDFIERRQAVHFLGPPGTGKSHLSIALGVEAVRAGKSVYFGSLAEIVNSMAKAEREGNLPQRVRFLARNSLLIVDLCAVPRYVESPALTSVRRGFEAVKLHITGTSYRDSSVHLNGRFTCWNFSFPAIGRAMPPARNGLRLSSG